jgi:hypothetical protein
MLIFLNFHLIHSCKEKVKFIRKLVSYVLKKAIRAPYDTSSTVIFSSVKNRDCNGENCVYINQDRFTELQKITKLNAVKSLRQFSEIKLNYISSKVDELESNISSINGRLCEIVKVLKRFEMNAKKMKSIKIGKKSKMKQQHSI